MKTPPSDAGAWMRITLGRPSPMILSVALATLGGCGRPQPVTVGPNGGNGTPTAVPAKVANPSRMPTMAEARAFAKEVERAVAAHDKKALSAMFDWDALLETATGGMGAKPETRKGFANGCTRALEADTGLVGLVCQGDPNAPGRFKSLRNHEEGGRRRVLFRFFPPGGGFAYYDLVLDRPPGGKARAVDVYVYTTGELMSQTLHRAFLPLLAHESRGLIDRLAGREQEFHKHINEVVAMDADLNAGKYREVIAAFKKLPESLRRDKNLLIMRLRAAGPLGGDEYAAAIEDFRAAFPRDPCLNMLEIDAHLTKREFDETIACIDRLDEQVGGDPYLNILRASTLREKGDIPAALAAARTAVRQEPTLLEGYLMTLELSLKAGDFAETLATLKATEGQFHLPFADLTTLPEYADFVKSPQGREWAETHADE